MWLLLQDKNLYVVAHVPLKCGSLIALSVPTQVVLFSPGQSTIAGWHGITALQRLKKYFPRKLGTECFLHGKNSPKQRLKAGIFVCWTGSGVSRWVVWKLNYVVVFFSWSKDPQKEINSVATVGKNTRLFNRISPNPPTPPWGYP